MTWFKRRPKHWTQEDRDWISVLARYNSEVARGIMHTDEWKVQMTKLQQQFDKKTKEDPPW